LKDGRTFDRYSSPMTSADGTYYGRVFYFRDVTEAKTAERRLRGSEEKFRAIFDHMHDGMMLMSVEPPGVSFANGSMERLLGYAGGELAGLPLARLHPAEHLSQVRAQFEGGAGASLNVVQDL